MFEKTFKKAETIYDWIKGLELAVDLGLITKIQMEQAIDKKIK